MIIKVKRANPLSSKFIGLMFQDDIQPIYIETRWGIHTMFVKRPIVVFILNDNNVVQIKKKIDPWRVFFWNPRYIRVLEMPFSDKRCVKITIGSMVDIK